MSVKFATKLLHGDFAPDKTTGSTTQAIFQTSAYAQETAEDMEKIFAGKKPGFIYSRVGNPTLVSFERRISALESGVGAVSFASGMAAVSMSVLNILSAGDEIVSSGSLFGGTTALFNELSSYGIATRFAKENNVQSFASLITDKTKLLYAETIGNPKLDVTDIKKLADLAHSCDLPLFIDNTLATPYLTRPISLGADVVIHSTSKAINGGGNSIGGIVVVGKFRWNPEKFPKLKEYAQFGFLSYLARLRSRMATDFGASLSPFNAYLTGIGLETLALRMERASDNALVLAEFLDKYDEIKVNYPGLSTNPYHELAKEQFNGKYGSMLTIRFINRQKAFKFINALKIVLNVSNIGDTKTLAIHPASTVFLTATDEEKERAGITEGLVRISVGIEDIDDLKEDFKQAIDAAIA